MSLVSVRHLPFGRFDESVREAETILAQDPFNAGTRVVLLASLSGAGLYDRTIGEARKAIEIDEHRWGFHFYHGCGYAYQDLFAEAREPFERAFQLAPWHFMVRGALAGVLACLGEKERAQQLAANIPEIAPTGLILYHRLCSNLDAAADWYEKAIEQRHPAAAVWAIRIHQTSPREPALAKARAHDEPAGIGVAECTAARGRRRNRLGIWISPG
jgi:tetratricopeptide (TPR) repeat protein